MQTLLGAAGPPAEVVAAVKVELAALLQAKRKQIQWKLEALRAAFEAEIKPNLAATA